MVLQDIPYYFQWSKVEEIHKGWSTDKKFYIEDTQGEKFLLRLSKRETYEKKKQEFEEMKRAYALDIHMSKPIYYGVCGQGEYVYALFSWIEGSPVDKVIQSYSNEEQYELGKEAGKILKKLHTIPAPEHQEDWKQRMELKFRRHLEAYRNCGVVVENDEAAIRYVQNHLDLLNNCQQVYQHGNFHIGNLIITPEQQIGVIDFNRWDYGDPYEEFYKAFMFSREKSIPFVKGQIDGYFQREIPVDFFQLVALYLADVALFSAAWAIPFGEEDVKSMVERAKMIFHDYDNFTSAIPKWFEE